MLAQGFLRVKSQAKITKCYFLWVGAINMQSLSGHYLMRQQVPMVFLLRLVYLGTVAYISVEITLGSFWRREAYGSKVKHKSQIATFYDFVWYAIVEWPLFDAPSSTHGVSYFFSLSKCCCLHFCRNKLGLLLVRGYSKGQKSKIYHKLQLFMTLCDMQSSSGNYSMRH